MFHCFVKAFAATPLESYGTGQTVGLLGLAAPAMSYTRVRTVSSPPAGVGQDGMECDGMGGIYGMGWDIWDGMGWDGMGF